MRGLEITIILTQSLQQSLAKMKVLVFGASGTVGFPVAQAFVRGGHVVYGLTRSKDKAIHLAKEEIIPVVGEITNPKVWSSLVASLDVIVDVCRGDDFDDTHSDLPVVAAAEAAKKLRPTHAPKLTFIATTGTWEFGNNRKEIKSDTTPLTEPIPILAFQPEAEHKILTDPVLNGIVIRPGVVYGRGGSILAPLFKSAYEGKVAWYGSPGTRYQTVHADDLAQLYLLAAEKAHLVGGKAFVGVNDMTESLDDFLQQLVVVSGAKGPYEYIKADSPFTEAMGTTTLIRPYLARTLLGWRPVKAGLVDGLETYYNAWKASAGLE